MNNESNMSKGEDFKLLTYLAADLRRVQVLLHGSADGVSGMQLWLGVFSPRFVPVLLCRLAYFFYYVRLKPVAKFFSLLNFFFFGIEIAIQCRIGKGLFLPHTQGTVIGAHSIGEDAIIFQGVTLGARELDFSYLESSRPTLGNSVTIGSGAKILGAVTVGSGSRIGANAVVLKSIPPNVAAAGVPARVTKVLS
jgi:serine O-acetyltransferase